MFDHTSKHHAAGPKHANSTPSVRGPVRKQHEHDPKFEKAQLAKDSKPAAPKPKANETPKREAVKPFPGEKGAEKKGLLGI